METQFLLDTATKKSVTVSTVFVLSVSKLELAQECATCLKPYLHLEFDLIWFQSQFTSSVNTHQSRFTQSTSIGGLEPTSRLEVD